MSDSPESTSGLPESARKVQEALARLGAPFHVVAMPETTRTAREAARAIGCAVGQIAKSIVFRGRASGKALLVVASGANRVDEKAIGRLAGGAHREGDGRVRSRDVL